MEVFSWWSFREIWKEHCSNIRISRPCNDTCGECTVSRNAFRYHESRKKEEYEYEDEKEGDIEDDDDVPPIIDRGREVPDEPDEPVQD
jgi:hypothetical protein